MKKLIIALCSVLLLCSTAGATDYCSESSCEGCWTFDESTYTDDSSSHGRDLSAETGVSETSSDCIYGDCVDFNGASTVSLHPAYDSAFMDTSSTFIVSLGTYVNPTGNGTNLFSECDSNLRVGYYCFMNTSGNIQCDWYKTGHTKQASLTSTSDSRGTPLTNVAVTYNSSGTSYLYINGEVEDSDSVPDIGYWQQSSNLLRFSFNDGWFNELDGVYDEAAFFSTPLTSTQINDIIDNCLKGSCGAGGGGAGKYIRKPILDGIMRGVL